MMDTIIQGLFISFVGLLLLNMILSTNRWLKLKERQVKLEESKFLANFDYSGSKNMFNSFLDEFINDCMKDYVMYYIIPDANLTYITKEKENHIRESLKALVINRLSESLKKKITLVYSEIFFNQILAEKIFYVVTVFVADFNNGGNRVTMNNYRREQTASSKVENIDDWGEVRKKK